jgi:autotransporter-associated beta strand protein
LVFQGNGAVEISGQVTGVGRVTSSTTGAGGRTLGNDANSYTGATLVNGGTLAFTSIENVGATSSSLGAPVLADATISIGGAATTGTLRYAGTSIGGHTSDRVINLAGTTGGATIEANGTGPLVLTGTNTATGLGVKTLTLAGTNTGNNSIGAIVNNSLTNTTAVTKSGAGKWIMTGVNTYTGATAINAGTLVITGATQDTTAITFGGGVLGLDIASPVTAANATVDFTGQSVLVTGSPALASYTLLTTTSPITGTPTLASPISGYTLQVFTNELRLVSTGGGSAYATWAAINAPSPQTPSDDFDGDGVSNAVEFVLGGLATSNDLGKLPVAATSGGNMTFTFQRAQSSIDPKTSTAIEVGTDLVTWNTAPSPYTVPDGAAVNNPGVTVVKDSPSVGTDTITLTVPQAPDAKKFARLMVVITP